MNKNTFPLLLEIVASVGLLALFVGVMATIVSQCKRPPPVAWHGINRDAALCDSDGWLTDNQMTCIDAGRKYKCVRERRDYQCAEVRP